MEDRLLRVAITHGDTNGIGYEVILKTFAKPEILELCTPVIYGSPKVAAYHSKALGMQNNFSIINDISEAEDGRVNLLTTISEEVKVELGQPSKEAGIAALKALEHAMADHKAGAYDLLVTAPINKSNIQSETFAFCGHTEFIADSVGEGQRPLMILMSGSLRVALVTTHLAIKDVASAISKEAIMEKAQILHQTLKRDFCISAPRIAVLALNPHCGDHGLLGKEEEELIIPAVQELEAMGIQAFGPFAADGFFGSGAHNKFDGILAMYHDQGLAPFKALAGDDGVNYTANLPIIRTSPAHGTAYDITGKNEADETSFRQAIYTAIDICRNRQRYDESHANPLPKLYHERRDDGEKNRFAMPKRREGDKPREQAEAPKAE